MKKYGIYTLTTIILCLSAFLLFYSLFFGVITVVINSEETQAAYVFYRYPSIIKDKRYYISSHEIEDTKTFIESKCLKFIRPSEYDRYWYYSAYAYAGFSFLGFLLCLFFLKKLVKNLKKMR